jgi:hypothetical protein
MNFLICKVPLQGAYDFSDKLGAGPLLLLCSARTGFLNPSEKAIS